MNWLMLSCKQATELIEKRSVDGLSAREKIRLRMHTSLCDGCTAYEKQNELINKLLNSNYSKKSSVVPPQVANTELEDRILKKLPE